MRMSYLILQKKKSRKRFPIKKKVLKESWVPKGLPSLIKAMRIQEKASGTGFKWANKKDALDKELKKLKNSK